VAWSPPLIGRVADATSLQTALTPLLLVQALAWLLFRTLPEPVAPPAQQVVGDDLLPRRRFVRAELDGSS
jgi:hypothetical protein